MLRDFSNSALSEIKGRYNKSIMKVQFSPAALMAANDAYAFRYDGYAAADQERSKKAEYYDGITASLDSIFKKVRDYDIQAKAFCSADVERCDQLNSVVCSLRDIIDPYPQSGVCPLTLPGKDIERVLTANNGTLLELTQRRFGIYDEYGRLVGYDWDEIERVLQRELGKITSMEYYALADFFSRMCEEDMEKFLQRLAEPGEPYSSASSNESRPTWTFNKTKADRLATCLAASFANQGRSFDNDSLTRLAILQALPGLGMNPSDLAESAGLHGLTAGSDAEYPPIDITFSPDSRGGAIIEYTVIGAMNSTTGGIDYPPTGAKCVLLPPVSAANSVLYWNQFLDERQRELFGVGSDDVLGMSADILAIPLAFVEGAVWPIDVAMSVGGIVLSISEIYDNQVASTQLTEALAHSTLLAQLYGPFGCQVIIASTIESSAEHQAFVYPGEHTQGRIDSLNAALSSVPEAVKLTAGLGYPVTYESIVRNPLVASQFMIDLDNEHPGLYGQVFNASQTS